MSILLPTNRRETVSHPSYNVCDKHILFSTVVLNYYGRIMYGVEEGGGRRRGPRVAALAIQPKFGSDCAVGTSKRQYPTKHLASKW